MCRPYRAEDRGSHAIPELFTKLSNRTCLFLFGEGEHPTSTQQAQTTAERRLLGGQLQQNLQQDVATAELGLLSL